MAKAITMCVLLRAGSRRQASLRKTDAVSGRDAVSVRENPSSGPAKPGQPLREWIRIHSSRLFPSRFTRPCSCQTGLSILQARDPHTEETRIPKINRTPQIAIVADSQLMAERDNGRVDHNTDS
jgi:hypothetical protein